MNQKIKINTDLGMNVKKLRLEAGFGVTELSKHMHLLGCDTTRETLNKIEAGKQNITLMQLRSFIHAFNITYNDFFNFLEEDHHERKD